MEIIGTTDERSDCECCGRSDLRTVVVLRDAEGALYFYGTTCAARAHGWEPGDVAKAARRADRAALAARIAAYHRKVNAESAKVDRFHAWVEAETGMDALDGIWDVLGGLTEAQAAYAAATA